MRIPPNRLVFVCPFGLQDRIQNAFNNSQFQFRDHINQNLHVTILPYCKNGRLLESEVISLYDGEWSFTDKFLVTVAQECVKNTLRNTSTVLHAPHGHLFRHPSGREESIFVRAGNMLREPALLAVFNHLILRKIPPNTKTIFIDSFTILSFALGLQSLIGYFARHSTNEDIVVPSIEIVRSYDVDTSFRVPNTNDYFVIVSASTSGNFAKKLIDEHNADESRIIHLFGVGYGNSPNQLQNSSIYFEERIGQTMTTNDSKIIRISNEEFMACYGNPIAVRLSKRHVCKNNSDRLTDSFYSEHLKFQTSGAHTGYGPYSPFTIANDSVFHLPMDICRWINHELIDSICSVPKAISTIVHLGNLMSQQLGENLKLMLNAKCGKKRISLVSISEFDVENKTVLLENSTVVVVASEDPDFEQFRKLTIKLRKRPDVYRYFVIGYAFPETMVQFNTAVADLTLVANSQLDYSFTPYLVMPIGSKNLHDSMVNDYGIDWQQTEKYLRSIGCNLYKLLQIRASNRIDENKWDLFFPSLGSEVLRLRHGSIFFKNEKSTDEDETNGTQLELSHVVVYLVISSALQTARESDNLSSPNLKFNENPFIRTVIDPEMFKRYSDGIIQAALLRALSKSELDYSDSVELSKQFREIAVTVINSTQDLSGEAALEFLAAVAKKKVLLRDEDRKSIEESAVKNNLKPFWEFFSHESPI